MKTSHALPGKPRLTKRQLQAMETKDKIYNAAIAEINKKGYSNVSIEDITTAANVAKGTFYTHFESKEAVVLYTAMQADKVYQRAYEQVRHLAFLPMVTQFVRLSYLENEKRGKEIIKAMVSNYFSIPDYNFYNQDRYLLRYLNVIVEAGKAQGALDGRLPTSQYVNTLLSTIIGMEVLWCFDEQGLSLADMMEDAVHTAARGMMK